MHEPLYRQALSQGWQLTWKHKYLWVFGLMATLLGQMGILELMTKVTMASSNFALYPTWLSAPALIRNMLDAGHFSLPVDGWMWFLWLAVIMLGFVILGIFVSVSSQGALVRASAQFTKKKNLPSFSTSWNSGVKHFWKVLFINLVKKVSLVVLSVFVGWGTLTIVMEPHGMDLFLFLLLFILAVFVGMVLSFLAIYAVGYIVVEEYSFGKAIESAWRLFLDHWLVSLEIALIILFLNVVAALLSVFAFLVFFMPTLITWFIAIFANNLALWIAGMVAGVLMFSVFAMFLGTILTTFTTSVWTYLFMKMHKEGVKSRIIHALTWKAE